MDHSSWYRESQLIGRFYDLALEEKDGEKVRENLSASVVFSKAKVPYLGVVCPIKNTH